MGEDWLCYGNRVWVYFKNEESSAKPVFKDPYGNESGITFIRVDDTVRSIPESPDGTVQPYSWIITDIDVHAKEDYLLEKLQYAKENVGQTQVFCDWEATEYVADYVYTDPFNAHVTYYQWSGSAGEEVTDQMSQQRDQWLWKNYDGKYGLYNNEPEIGTAKRQDYLAGRLSSEWRDASHNGTKDKRAYATDVKLTGGSDASADAPTAYPSTQTVELDGRQVEFQMYALKDANGNPTNYIKVRDLGFNVGWSMDRDMFSVTGSARGLDCSGHFVIFYII